MDSVSLDHIWIPSDLNYPKAELGDHNPRRDCEPPDDFPIPRHQQALDGSALAEWQSKCWSSADILKKQALQPGRINWPSAPAGWELRPALSAQEWQSLEPGNPFVGTRIDLRAKLCQQVWEKRRLRELNRTFVDLMKGTVSQDLLQQSEDVLQFSRGRPGRPYTVLFRGWGREWPFGGQPSLYLREQQAISITMYADVRIRLTYRAPGFLPVQTPDTFDGSEVNVQWPDSVRDEKTQRVINRLAKIFDQLRRSHSELFNVTAQRYFVHCVHYSLISVTIRGTDCELPYEQPSERALRGSATGWTSADHIVAKMYNESCRHFVAAYVIHALILEHSTTPRSEKVEVGLRDLDWTFDGAESMVPSREKVLGHPLMRMFYSDMDGH